MARIARRQWIPALSTPLKSSFLTTNHPFNRYISVFISNSNRRSFSSASSASKITMSLRAGIVGFPNVGKFTLFNAVHSSSPSSRSPSISIWRRKKEMGKEGLIVAKEMKRLQSNPLRLHKFMQDHVSRLLKSDLVSVLAEFQRQDQIFLSMKLYDIVRKEIWYRPDMFFYRDMLMTLARNKKVEEAKLVWTHLKSEEVLFDQHTFGDIIRAFLDNGLPNEAMEIYDEMRQSPDPPLSLPYRVIMKGLISYSELRERVKTDFLELFPGKFVYEPPEDLFEDQEWKTDSEGD